MALGSAAAAAGNAADRDSGAADRGPLGVAFDRDGGSDESAQRSAGADTCSLCLALEERGVRGWDASADDNGR